MIIEYITSALEGAGKRRASRGRTIERLVSFFCLLDCTGYPEDRPGRQAVFSPAFRQRRSIRFVPIVPKA